MPQLCAPERCTACSACLNSCQHGAIAMSEDAHGELHPVVDHTRCVGCGLCSRACPELEGNAPRRYGRPEVYCCWLTDAALRRGSTSGGAAYALSAGIIAQGGHVYGAAYDGQMTLRYTEADTLDELHRLQKSKYVQSEVGLTFRRIREELRRGDLVFFTGTGCHVKGLRAFLARDYDNLLTADLVCHGVPGAGIFAKYIHWLEAKYGDRVVDFLPRHKRGDGQEVGYYSMVTFERSGEVKLTGRDNSYFTGFQHNLFLRDACHDCQANGPQRFADFTLGDFWGLGKLKPFNDDLQRPYGISMLALNTPKARALFEKVRHTMHCELRSYEEASVSNHQYHRCAVPSPQRSQFYGEWKEADWATLADKYMRMTAKEDVLWCIKRFTPPSVILC